jgi:hypothetical protein
MVDDRYRSGITRLDGRGMCDLEFVGLLGELGHLAIDDNGGPD